MYIFKNQIRVLKFYNLKTSVYVGEEVQECTNLKLLDIKKIKIEQNLSKLI